jgi:chromosomal replication initiator protein
LHFYIGTPNTFVAEYLEKNQRSLIEKVLTGIVNHEIRVDFQVNGNGHKPAAARGRAKPAPVQQSRLPLFNPKYTFDSFVVGSSNQLAHAAAMGVAIDPGNGYNPLFIYGKDGLGKTHLLHAIGNTALENNLNVMYVRAEEYTNQLMSALREKKTEEFRNRYRSVDMLLVDDVQFFSGKTQTEENFFHTFEELHSGNHQIAVTSDCPPSSIPSLQSKMRSRFEWGLTVDIQPPDLETRLAILQSKAENVEVEILPDVLEMIAEKARRNIRELEGSLNRVIAYAKLLRSQVTRETASRALRDIAGNKQASDNQFTPTLLLNAVADSFQLSPEIITGPKRDKEAALARQITMYLLKQQNGYSLGEIGNMVGGRNPSTVSHACEKIARDIENSPVLRRKVMEIQSSIKSDTK